MSRKRKKPVVEAAPVEEILADGSGPVAVETPSEPQAVEAAGEPDAIDADAIDAIDASDAIDEIVAESGEQTPLEEALQAAAEDPPGDPEDASAIESDGDIDPELAASADEASELESVVDEATTATLPTSAAALDGGQLKSLVEALVFASDKPMTVLRLRQLTRISDTKRLEEALAALAEDYRERGLILQQVSGGWQFRTRTQWASWVQQLIAGRPVRLTRAQLETLSIIAYRQPITRPEIDDIRGVDSSATLKLLMERGLIRTLGKKEEAGRPMLYGTTKEFLDFFSLGDLRELPTLREYSELTDESRRVIDDRLGPDDDDEGGGSSDGGSGGGGGHGDGASGGSDPVVHATEEVGLDEIFAGSDDVITGMGEAGGDAVEDVSLAAESPADTEEAAPITDHANVVTTAESSELDAAIDSRVNAASADEIVVATIDHNASVGSIETTMTDASVDETAGVQTSVDEPGGFQTSAIEASLIEGSAEETNIIETPGVETVIAARGEEVSLVETVEPSVIDTLVASEMVDEAQRIESAD